MVTYMHNCSFVHDYANPGESDCRMTILPAAQLRQRTVQNVTETQKTCSRKIGMEIGVAKHVESRLC